MSTSHENQNRPRFRFSLKLLFLVFTAVAAMCWALWIGWPRWQIYREKVTFEESIKRIRRGDLIHDMWGLLGQHERGIRGTAADAQGRPVGWIQYDWPNAVYFLYCPLQLRAGGNPDYDLTERVEVFRLAPAPRGYEPHTARGQNALPDRNFAYTRDFLEFIAGDRQQNPGFEYELIHADAE
jgi:hypothetical protein